jgi:hypothetical protein
VTFLRKPKPTKGCSANGRRSINTRNNCAVDGDDNDDDNNKY